MILLLGGTSESRTVALALKDKGYRFLISYATHWGEAALRPPTHKLECECRQGALDQADIEKLIVGRRISVIIDATHPFAAAISKCAIAAAQSLGVRYLRLERPSTLLPSTDLVKIVPDFIEAANLSFHLGGKVMTTIGVRNLRPFVQKAQDVGGELMVRLLPRREAISAALDLGLFPAQLLALPGACGVELNRSILREYNCRVVVCKDSGKVGGTPEKLEAAVSLGLPAVMVERPKVDYPEVVDSPPKVIEVLGKWLP